MAWDITFFKFGDTWQSHQQWASGEAAMREAERLRREYDNPFHVTGLPVQGGAYAVVTWKKPPAALLVETRTDEDTLTRLRHNLEWLRDTTEELLGKLLLVGEAAAKYDGVPALFTLTAQHIAEDWAKLQEESQS
jgi:hypothetical protein